MDLQPNAVHWARSRPGKTGLQLVEWGRLSYEHDAEAEELLRAIAASPWVRACHVEVPLRSPDLTHRRVELPPLSARQAQRVGHRKVRDFLAEQDEACIGSFIRVRQNGAFPIWMVAVPTNVPPLFEERWRSHGFDVYRLGSETLALGNLVRLLPPLGDGELCAFLDLHREGGDCVVADSRGWLFNRMIPIRHGRALGMEESRNELALEKEDGLSRVQLERIATELGRTFVYVERELQLGRVTRLALSGQVAELESLREHVAQQLDVEVRCIGDFVARGPAAGLPASAARAVGLALAADVRGCSLLPPSSKARRRVRRARQRLRVALAVGGTALCVLGASMLLRAVAADRAVAQMTEEMGSNVERLAIIDETARTRERARSLASLLDTLRRPEPPWWSYVTAIARTLPSDVALEELRIERGEEGWSTQLSLEARGTAVSDAAGEVARFRERLERAPFLTIRHVGRDPGRQTIQEETRSRVFFVVRGTLATLAPGASAAQDGAVQDPVGLDDARRERAGAERR